MSKIIDITNKLNFEEKPCIQIKGTVIPVNNDAASMLKVMAIMEESATHMTTENIERLEGLLFDEEAAASLRSLKLTISDYVQTIMQTAMVAANHFEEDEQGEEATPATT